MGTFWQEVNETPMSPFRIPKALDPRSSMDEVKHTDKRN